MPQYISSLQNPKLKLLLALQAKSSERERTGLFAVEGVKEVSRCIEGGFRLDSVFYCPSIIGKTEEGVAFLANLPREVHRFELSEEAYSKVAYRGGTEGIIAEVRQKKLSLSDLSLRAGSSDMILHSARDNKSVVQNDRAEAEHPPLFVVLESVEKPGNLGAVLRTADATGATAVIVCNPLTDLYNPNLIRSSVGTAFTVPTVACTSEEGIEFLKSHGVKILTAQLQDSSPYYDADMTGPTAIVFGTEHDGLSRIWRDVADAHILIPMLGSADSLNVSVSAAILLYEALRQRLSHFKPSVL